MTDAELRALLVRPGDTVGTAHERVLAGGLGLAVVADAEDQVVGTITDGAIRRSALDDR